MSAVSEKDVKALIDEITDHHAGKGLVESGWLRGIGIDGDKVSVDLRAGYPIDGVRVELEGLIRSRLEAAEGISGAAVNLAWRVFAHQVQGELKPMEEIRNIIAVGSGKGGVGKSSVAANLALALKADGARVGLLDADIYGPSVPRMLGVKGRPEAADKRIIPMRAHGVQLMSIGFLVDEETPMIWRGPMVTSALQQLLNETAWEDLDYLVVDLPPGTGDIQLTLAQKVPVSGAVIVTTPQDIALLDARKALQMFRKVNVSVLGIVENMSTHICSACSHEEPVFGSGGGERMAQDYRLPLLGQLPLDIAIRRDLDAGKPSVAADPDSAIARRFREFARNTAARLAQTPRSLELNLPTINIQNA